MKKSLTTLLLVFAAVISCATWDAPPVRLEPPPEPWVLVSENVTATVYNAVPSQCNADCTHTASMYRINTADVLQDRIIAMERTMMRNYGLHYGDTVRIEGTGRWDGTWQIQDTMNKRFAGQEKIDILVPNHIRHGKWTGVKVYARADAFTRTKYANL